MIRLQRIISPALGILAAALVCGRAEGALFKRPDGQHIWKNQCARCHGEQGEGVADKADEALYGDKSIEALARVIARTMPEDKEKKSSPEEAKLVAEYMHAAFYSPEARLRFQPPRIELARLTVPQYQNTLADLMASFRPAPALKGEHGLAAVYYNARNFRNEKKAIERVDAQVVFDFGEAGPSPDTNVISDQEFAVRWRGSVVVEQSGDYEFGVRTQNGAKLWVNDEERPLIDAWVSSGTVVREERAVIRLLAGRAYPIQLDYFKYKDKTASIILEWRPPHKAWQPIPADHLTPTRVPQTFVTSAAFPPDDASVGYERGTTVSKEWDNAATQAAIEAAGFIVDNLDGLSGSKAGSEDRAAKTQAFMEQFVERAFRQPLSSEEKAFFVGRHFEGAKEAKEVEQAVKRSALLALKSPRFLYPALAPGGEDHQIASRLSYALWDTMPDEELLTLARNGQLRSPELVRAQAERMLQSPKAKAKVHGFFDSWLSLEEAEDISKDAQEYPDFTEEALSDLRVSLEMFLDEVVWGGSSDYRQLLLADYVYVNERLAKMYGAPAPEGGGFHKAVLDPKKRSGVITHPYLLSMFAYHKSTSPIHRGVFLTRNIVGRALRPPPMDIQFMDGRFDPSLTMREKVTELTSSKACMTCHSVINPLGFSLENFDAIGRFRTKDNNKPVDVTGRYTGLDGKSVRIRGARDVAEYAARSPDAHRAFIQQLFHHTVKQPAAAYGPDTLEELRQSFAASNYNIQKLIIEIARRAALHGEPAQPGAEPKQAAKETEPKGKRS